MSTATSAWIDLLFAHQKLWVSLFAGHAEDWGQACAEHDVQ